MHCPWNRTRSPEAPRGLTQDRGEAAEPRGKDPLPSSKYQDSGVSVRRMELGPRVTTQVKQPGHGSDLRGKGELARLLEENGESA